jgi:uroporphyrinogen decarboxylase
MLHNPKLLHGFLQHLTDMLITYVGYQIESGAQVVQLFDSWAHHLSPSQFQEFSLPYANKVTEAVRARYPHVPIIFHANGGARGVGVSLGGGQRRGAWLGCERGLWAHPPLLARPYTTHSNPTPAPPRPLCAGTGKLEEMRASNADVIGLDWATTMTAARAALGPDHKVQGNVDPMVLFGPAEAIESEVNKVLLQAGPRGHILNVGHGVVQGTPEENVGLFCDLARRSGDLFAAQRKAAAAVAV